MDDQDATESGELATEDTTESGESENGEVKSSSVVSLFLSTSYLSH